MPTLTIDSQQIDIRRATANEVIDLRHRVLRQSLPREEAIFAGDELPTSGHFGAFLGNTILCCATFHLSQWQNSPAYQLRGMATEPGFRGKGLGRSVLQLGETEMTNDGQIRQLWCNAREIAVPFYQSMGWAVVSEKFEIPTAGPHFRMTRRVEPIV